MRMIQHLTCKIVFYTTSPFIEYVNMLKRIAIIITLLTAWLIPCYSSAQSSLIESQQDDGPTFEDEIRFPLVGPKLKVFVKAYMQEVAKGLYREGYKVETMRQGEVVIVIIPSDELFIPNEDDLLPSAGKKLDPIAKFLATHNDYKMLICAHTDDTGSEGYSLDLSEMRINAILDYFEAKHYNVNDVIGFPIGFGQPTVDNDTRLNRAQNRRIEFYIIPSEGILAKARNKK